MDRIIKYQKCDAGHPTHDTIKVPTVLGEMTVFVWDKYKDQALYCPGQDDVSRSLINGEVWEKHMAELVHEILEKGDRNKLVIDVGSHIGWYSRMAWQYGYDIEAFDADAENNRLFEKNVPSITPHLFEFNSDTNGKYVSTKEVELLKIDIEGSEQYAISYFQSILPLTQNILLEVSPVFNDSYPSLIEKIKGYGFEVFNNDKTPFAFNYDFLQTDLWLKKI